MRILILAMLLMTGIAPGAAAQARTIPLTATASLRLQRDTILDRDANRLMISSSTGVMAMLQLGCDGARPEAQVRFADGIEGSTLLLRTRRELIGVFPQRPGPPMRTWGNGPVRLVHNEPTGIATIPSAAIPQLVRGIEGRMRFVAFLESPDSIYETWFDAARTAPALDSLPCLHAPPPADEVEYDSAAVLLADSALIAAGLDSLRPVMDRAVLGYVLARARVTPEGLVDAVELFGLREPADQDSVRTFIRGLRFIPAQRDGQPVRSSTLLNLYRSDKLPRHLRSRAD